MAAICTGALALPNPFLETLQAEVVSTRSRDGPLRQLHAERAVEAAVEDVEHAIALLPPVLALGGPRAAAQELLAPLRLLQLAKRIVRLDRADRRQQIAGGPRPGRRDRGLRGLGRPRGDEEQGAVGALPLDGVGHGRGRRGEAGDVPGRRAGPAREGFVRGRLPLADHANAVAIAGEVADVRHGRGAEEAEEQRRGFSKFELEREREEKRRERKGGGERESKSESDRARSG